MKVLGPKYLQSDPLMDVTNFLDCIVCFCFIITVRKWLITMVIVSPRKSPKDRVVSPLPSGRNVLQMVAMNYLTDWDGSFKAGSPPRTAWAHSSRGSWVTYQAKAKTSPAAKVGGEPVVKYGPSNWKGEQIQVKHTG